MRWLQNISFSSSCSSSSSSASSGSSSRKHFEDNINSNQRNQNQRPKSRYHYLGLRISGARLRRQKEPKRLPEQEPPKKEDPQASPLSAGCDTPSLSTSPASKTTSSALAVPLPLPLPLPEGDGEQRFPSPKEVGHSKGLEDRDSEKADESIFLVSSVFACCDSRKATKNVETVSSSRVLQQEVNKDNQIWSAPEMNALDVAGLPPRAFHDYNAYTTDNTPLHSPNRSPHRKNRSQSGPPSPIHQRLSLESIEISSLRSESNGPISVHPLPLPPGATVASPPASIPQVANKPESLPMNCRWQKGKLIGRGTFGSVYVASNRETGALCAMKEVDIFPDDPKSAECIKQLEQEIKVLSHLKHPNIVQYYGSEIVEDKFYIYLEYVHPGSINKYVRDHCGAITESVVRNFTRHILCGLAYLHSTKTIHRDIKGANLLVDASGVVKLADFGMSKHLSGQRADLSLKGSPYWMAPELMQAVMQKDNSSELALAVDTWSLGCTIIEMFTGKAPWSEYEGAAAMFKVMRDTPPIPETLSPEGRDFLRCCFQRNPAERPSASVLLEHRFVKSSLQSGTSSSSSSFNGTKGCTS
ncbi:hypothetical protein V6Z11_D12G077100 [Gossypium hirsutum]